MTTKTPSSVRPAAAESLEKIAYAAAAEIPTAEPHDQDRLGYNLWLWLTNRRDPLPVVVRTSGARLLIGEEEALQRIREKLTSLGVTL